MSDEYEKRRAGDYYSSYFFITSASCLYLSLCFLYDLPLLPFPISLGPNETSDKEGNLEKEVKNLDNNS